MLPFARLRQALVPKDPFCRRETGAGRRPTLLWKMAGGLVVVSAYLLWAVWVANSNSPCQVAVTILTVATACLSLLALVLGARSVRGEISSGTAEALIVTPVSRRRLIVSKLAGSVEFMVVAALLLPLYCFAGLSGSNTSEIAAYVHGGLMRWLVDRSWGFDSLAWDVVWGIGAFASDVTWYLLFAACGVWAAVSRKGALLVWLKGLGAAASFLGLAAVPWLVNCGAAGRFLRLLNDYGDPKWGPITFWDLCSALLPRLHWCDVSVAWATSWWAAGIIVRVLLAWLLLSRAARHFDRIATD